VLASLGPSWIVVRVIRVSLLVLLSAIALAVFASAKAGPAQAGCGYRDYGTAYDYRDPGIWISLRRSDACRIYAVVSNKYANGRSNCGFSLINASNTRGVTGSCPAAGTATWTLPQSVGGEYWSADLSYMRVGQHHRAWVQLPVAW